MAPDDLIALERKVKNELHACGPNPQAPMSCKTALELIETVRALAGQVGRVEALVTTASGLNQPIYHSDIRQALNTSEG